MELYYEDQKPESKRRAENYVKSRLPKFLSYFERVLDSKASGDGPWLYAGKLTYADLVLFQVRHILFSSHFSSLSLFSFLRLANRETRLADKTALANRQCIDGIKFMFPKAMAKLEREGRHAKVFALHSAVKELPRIKAYLESPRRQKYSNGIYRYYEELDIEG